MDAKAKDEESCKIDLNSLAQIRSQLPRIAEEIIENCNDRECYTHVDYEPIPSRESVIEIIDRLRESSRLLSCWETRAAALALALMMITRGRA